LSVLIVVVRGIHPNDALSLLHAARETDSAVPIRAISFHASETVSSHRWATTPAAMSSKAGF
jgi:hypothetical protein